MRRLLSCLVLLLLAVPSSAEAKYRPLNAWELFGCSDLVVATTILSEGEATFRVRVDAVLGGEPKGPELQVRKFRPWACAPQQPIRYTPGARVLLCLNVLDDGSLRIASAGGEGAMPITKGAVLKSRISLPAPTGQAAPSTGLGVPLEALVPVVRRYRELFVFEAPRHSVPRRVRPKATQAEIDAFRVSSPLAKALVDTTPRE